MHAQTTNCYVIQLMAAITHKELVIIHPTTSTPCGHKIFEYRTLHSYTYSNGLMRIRGFRAPIIVIAVAACPFDTHNGIPTNCCPE